MHGEKFYQLHTETMAAVATCKSYDVKGEIWAQNMQGDT